MLEPAKQSWFDRFSLNLGDSQKKKICVRTYVMSVCVARRV